MRKSYIGDGVYVELDDVEYGLVLTTEDGVSVTNRIVLEPEVWHRLEEYVKMMQGRSLSKGQDNG